MLPKQYRSARQAVLLKNGRCIVQLTANIDSDDFRAAMASIPELAAKEIRAALSKSAQAVVSQAQAVHKFNPKSGNLDRSIQRRMSPDEPYAAEVFFNIGIATYGKYQNYGTKEHPVTPKSRKALYFVSGGGKAFSKGHTVRGIKAEYFVEEAAKVKTPNFIQAISDAAGRVIQAAGLKG